MTPLEVAGLDALLTRPDVARNGLSSLCWMTPACRREIKRRVARGDLWQTPHPIWPHHVQWFA